MELVIALTRTASFFQSLFTIDFSFLYGSKNNGALRDTVKHNGILQYQKLNWFWDLTEPKEVECRTRKALEMIIPPVLTNSMAHSLSEKLIYSSSGSQRNSPKFTEPGASLPCSHQPATCAYPESRQSSQYTPTRRMSLTSIFNITFPSKYWSFKWSPSLRFPPTDSCLRFSSPQFVPHGLPTTFFHSTLIYLNAIDGSRTGTAILTKQIATTNRPHFQPLDWRHTILSSTRTK